LPNNTTESDKFQEARKWRELVPPDGMDDPGNWEQVGTIMDRMILAWDKVEEREEATSLAVYSTERQRALILQALWLHGSPAWLTWARGWIARQDGKS
jgi:hypothetical protein